MEQQSSSNHIDKSVILILLTTILVSVAALSIKAFNHEPCEIVSFDVEGNQYRVGEIIRFKDYTENVTERKWSFGDSSESRYIVAPFHTYKKPGAYTIQLLINGKCESEREIVIKEKIEIIDSTRIANFKIPNTITVGELLKVRDLTNKATSWEWRFGETSEVNSTFQNPTYIYETEGLKTVTLIVNGDPRYSFQKQISVLPKVSVRNPTVATSTPAPTIREISRKRESLIKYDPVINSAPPSGTPEVEETTPIVVAPPPVVEAAKPEAKQISRSAFAKKVQLVANEEASAKDFKEYMCGNLQVTTMVKGKKTTFSEFCKKIKGKKISIKSLELFKNEKTKCIEYISISYSKGFF